MPRILERTVPLSELNLRGIMTNTAAGPVTLYASDSGILFLNTYAGDIEYTLPAVADCKGKMFLFFNADDQDLKITSAAANISVYGQTGITEQTSVTYSDKPGAACAVMCDGTFFLFLNFCGTEPDTLA